MGCVGTSCVASIHCPMHRANNAIDTSIHGWDLLTLFIINVRRLRDAGWDFTLCYEPLSYYDKECGLFLTYTCMQTCLDFLYIMMTYMWWK